MSLRKNKVFCFSIIFIIMIFIFSYVNIVHAITLDENKETIEDSIDIIEEYSIGENKKNIFEDVTSDMYFSSAIESLYKRGIVKGYSETIFGPLDTLTKSEALTLLLRLSGRDVDNVEDGEWYKQAIDLAEKMNIFRETESPTDIVSRKDIARYICKIYNFDMVNISSNQIFVDCNSLYANAMYQIGLFIGAEREEGLCFLPDEGITRGDMCLVLNRVLNTLEPIYTKTIHIGNYEIVLNPVEVEDYFNVLFAVLEEKDMAVKIPFSKYLNDYEKYLEISENIKTAYYFLYGREPELFGVYDNISITNEHDKDLGEGYLTIKLYSDLGDYETISFYNEEFRNACKQIVEDCYNDGIFNENTTKREKARYFYKYVITHCRYDFKFSSLSYTGYGAAVLGKAVCQGYTAMFNYLCDLEDIENEAVIGEMKGSKEPHTWTKIKFGDEWRYCDVTFGDSNDYSKDYCDFKYFDMSYEEIMRDRVENN